MNPKELDFEILAKIEEQNRAFLADDKAISSINLKRRGDSICSALSNESSTNGVKAEVPVTNTAWSNGISLPSVVLWATGGAALPSAPVPEQWAYVLNNWDQFVKKRSIVANLIRKGLPDQFRPSVWRLFTGANVSNIRKLYESYLEIPSPVEKAIRRDIARTFPKHDLFKDKHGWGQESLFRIIKAYSIHDKEVGYCQGSGFIVGLLLMQLPEADAFAVFVELMITYRLREIYAPSMLKIGVSSYQLERLLSEYLPDLYAHFLTHSLASTLYCSPWFLTLFSTILPVPMATRVLDLFIAEGFPFIFRMSLALLKFSARNLLAADMESMVVFLQNEGPTVWGRNAEIIFDSATSFKISTKKMKKWEKEYLKIRSHEREDQIELRRLRTENGLLLQRIARLDEECTSMADRLVQSQLTRAQESETMLALRCELSLLRRSVQPVTSAVLHTSTSNNVNGEPVFDVQLEELRNHIPSSFDESTHTRTTNATACNAVDNGLLHSRFPTKSPPSDTGIKFGFNGYSCTDTVNDGNIDVLPDYIETYASTFPLRKSHRNFLRSNDDALMLATLNRLHSDLASCRAREADTKKCLLELKSTYNELVQSKLEFSARSSEEIATLKDELCDTKMREIKALERLNTLREQLTSIKTMWEAHVALCQPSSLNSRSSVSRATLVVDRQRQNHHQCDLSDRIPSACHLDEVASLKQQIDELTMQNTHANHRADRLEQRIQELIEAQNDRDAVKRGLQLELQQALLTCAEIEAKRQSDSVMWRSQVIELTTHLTELRQSFTQLQCKYESLLATQRLVSDSVSGHCDSQSSPSLDLPCSSGSPTTGHTEHSSDDSSVSSETKITPQTSTCDHSTDILKSRLPSHDSNGVVAIWSDPPLAIMTDSIGPLEDLRLMPDDCVDMNQLHSMDS